MTARPKTTWRLEGESLTDLTDRIFTRITDSNDVQADAATDPTTTAQLLDTIAQAVEQDTVDVLGADEAFTAALPDAVRDALTAHEKGEIDGDVVLVEMIRALKPGPATARSAYSRRAFRQASGRVAALHRGLEGHATELTAETAAEGDIAVRIAHAWEEDRLADLLEDAAFLEGLGDALREQAGRVIEGAATERSLVRAAIGGYVESYERATESLKTARGRTA